MFCFVYLILHYYSRPKKRDGLFCLDLLVTTSLHVEKMFLVIIIEVRLKWNFQDGRKAFGERWRLMVRVHERKCLRGNVHPTSCHPAAYRVQMLLNIQWGVHHDATHRYLLLLGRVHKWFSVLFLEVRVVDHHAAPPSQGSNDGGKAVIHRTGRIPIYANVTSWYEEPLGKSGFPTSWETYEQDKFLGSLNQATGRQDDSLFCCGQ